METESGDVSNREENILYEITVANEWQESETLVKNQERDEASKKAFVSLDRSYRSYFPTFLSSSITVPASVKKLIDSRLSWQFAVGGEGKVIAVLQETTLELRTSKDEYATVVGKSLVVRDPFPQWRKVTWSRDCNLLAVGFSCGSIDVFDLKGCKLFSIPKNDELNSGSCSDALVDLSFVEHRIKKTQWAAELIVCNYKGQLSSYLLNFTGDYQLNFTFSFANDYPYGVSSLFFHPNLDLLFVASVRMKSDDEPQTCTSASHYAIAAWRILTDSPYYKLITTLDDDKAKYSSPRNLRRYLSAAYLFQKTKQDCIFKLSLSPGGDKLAAIHTSGCLSVWQIPSLRLFRLWRLVEQPAYNSMNPSLLEYHSNKKRLAEAAKNEFYFHPIDVNWWSDWALILARYCGSVSISSVTSLKNLLGDCCEWFEPYPTVSVAHDKGFLTLECETQVTSKKRSSADDEAEDESSDDDEDDENEDDAESILRRSSGWVKSALYFMTDSERFQPPRKKPKVLTKTFRLICLKSTTPEELYNRKMDNEEYGDALALAKAHNLDTDLVYQRQWKKTVVSITSIQDYLSKIKKRSWVLHECLERVSNDIDAERELLLFGLRGTSLETLVASNDEGFSTTRDDDDNDSDEDDEEYEDEPGFDKPSQKMKRLLSRVDFKNLTLEQKQIIITRRKLLAYFDKLNTYEVMLGGGQSAGELFDSSFFNSFRAQSPVEATINFARSSDWNKVHVMFTHHGNEILANHLLILSNFPETTSPYEYRSLLPEAEVDGKICSWDQVELREQDWSEDICCTNAIGAVTSSNDSALHDLSDSSDWEIFSSEGNKLSHSLVTKWYLHRAREIEKRTRLVDFSLELIKLGQERNIQGLGELHDELLTLETLIYECRVECTLDEYEKTTNMEKVLLLMKTSKDDVYIANVRRWLIPFMSRLENSFPGSSSRLFREYLLHMSRDSLNQCLLIFQNSRMELTNAIIQPTSELIDLALCCVYTCTANDQLTVANVILECLPSRNYGPDTPEMLKLHDQIDEFEQHMKAGFILNKHGIKENLPVIRQCQDDSALVKELLVKLTRNAGKCSYSESEWEKLLLDILELQRIFRSVSPTLCYEIFVESLLCSGSNTNINLSRRYMELSSTTSSMLSTKQVSYERTVELILSAAREYFNASISLTDPTMDLAKMCLGLIADNPTPIEEELDLISALSILNELLDPTSDNSLQNDDRTESTILPLQVRLSVDRLDLVRLVLTRSSNSYKYPQRLLKLAYLLRVSGDDKRKREGRVLTLAAEVAFEKKDFVPCSHLCVQVMEGGHEDGWKVCNLLGQCNQFEDLRLKCRLMSFSVIYCPSDEIESVIRCRCLVEAQLLQNEIRTQIELKEPSVETGVINLWKQALKFVRLENENDWNFYDKNMNLDRQGCLTFYLSLVGGCHASDVDVNYRHFAAPTTPSQLKFTRNLFRAALLAESVTRGENHCMNSEILLELSRETTSNDTALGLAYLLTVNSMTDVERYFSELPRSEISLQLTCYYFALKFCVYAKKVDLKTIFSSVPEEVINLALNQNDFDTSNENLNLSKKLLKNHYQKLSDLIQGKLLHDLGRGVDVIRFSMDDEYKKDTILGLAMTLENDVYETSVALALKYGLPLNELYRNHLQFLFSQSDIPTNEIERRVVRLKLLEELKIHPEETCGYLSKFIYPTIDGTDHARLIYYYQLMDECGIKGSMELNSIQSRMRLLKKLTKLTPNLDFKKLMDSEDPLSILFPSLTASNVQSVSKLANQLTSKEGPLDQSSVYGAWIRQIFFRNCEELVSYSDWVHRFESCHEFVRKLNANGVTRLINEILFSRQSIEKIPLESRKEIVKRLLKLARQESKKSEDWGKCVLKLVNAKNHLDWLSSESVQSVKRSDLGSRVDELDLAMSQPEQVHRVLVKCVVDGESVESLQHLVSIIPSECSSAPGDIILDALRDRVEELRNSLSDEPLESLRKIVEQIRVHLNSNGDLVIVDDVVSVVRTFFSDDQVPIDVRLRVLEELDKAFCLDDYDRSLILFYRTQLIVSSAFPEILVSSSDVSDDTSRDSYFDFLLTNSTSITQQRLLCQLLFSWPPLPSCSSTDISHSPWIRVLSSMLATRDTESCHEFISLFTHWPQNVPQLSLPSFLHLLPLIPTETTQIYYLKICLISDYPELHQKAIDRIKASRLNLIDYDDDLFNHLLRHRLTPQIVSSDLFAPYCSHLFSTHFNSVPTVAKELKDAGFVLESGALLLRHHSTPRSLQLFNSALRVARHWLEK